MPGSAHPAIKMHTALSVFFIDVSLSNSASAGKSNWSNGPLHALVGRHLGNGLAGHRITSSARSTIESGMVSRRALAVLRLTVNLKPVACSTGRSLGFAPFSSRSTK